MRARRTGTTLLLGWMLACGGSAEDSSAGSGGTSAGSAGTSAGSGGTSAGSAGTSAGSGGTSAGSAGTSAGSAGTSAGSAGTSAGSGGTSAGSAGTSAGSAGTSAGSAGAAAAGGGAAAGSGGGTGTDLFAAPQVPRTFTYRIGKAFSPAEAPPFDVVGLDLFDNSKETITALRAKGKTVICYFSSTYEDWRPDYASLGAADQAALDALLAGPLDSWPGEQWVDLRGFSATSPSGAHTLLRKVLGARIQQARDKGCDAVDFDNVNEHENGVKNKAGQPITALDQLTFNVWLADEAHAAGLRAFLKNDLTQIADSPAYPGGKGLARVFDGAIDEQCFEFAECQELTPFRDLGKPIFVVEYAAGASFPSPSQQMTANTLHLNVSAYAKPPETALADHPSKTFGAW